MPNNAKQDTLAAYSADDPPIFMAIIRYFHAAAGYPVRSTWLKYIGAGNYALWPGLTLTNATNYYPSSEATNMVHLVQKHRVEKSTKPKPPQPSATEEPMPHLQSNELFLQVKPISKLYNDDTGCFPIRS